MLHYTCFGLNTSSEIELPDLPPAVGEPEIFIRLGRVPRERRKATLDEEIAFHVHGGAFHISGGREIVVEPLPGVDPDVLRVLLLGRIMAFLLRQRGWLPLHASGVEVGGEAVLFLGPSGSGKSTTAAAFHSRGHQVLTDDVAAVQVQGDGQCLVRTAGSRLRLNHDSTEVFAGMPIPRKFQWDKHLFDLADEKQPELFRVQKIYVLENGHAISSARVPPMSALALLSKHSFVRHERMNEEALTAHLGICSATVRAVSISMLFRSASLAALPNLVDWVERDLCIGRL